MSVAYAWNLITRTEDTIKNYLSLYTTYISETETRSWIDREAF